MGDHKAQNRDGCWVFILFTLFYVFVFVFFFFVFLSRAHCMWKFPGQVSIQGHSSNLNTLGDRTLTHYAKSELWDFKL